MDGTEVRELVVVSYFFPPNLSIGARRWGKFVKFLVKDRGLRISVVCTNINFDSLSERIKNVKYICVRSLYPKILMNSVYSLLERIQYKFWLETVKVLSKANYFDKGVFSSHIFRIEVLRILKNNPKAVVVVSGAPFSICYQIALLKEKFKDFTLIVDFRDPWTWGEKYGMKLLGDKRIKLEKAREQVVIANSNYITIPSANMKSYLISKYSNYATKFVELPHAYDDEVVSSVFDLTSGKNGDTDKVNLVYGGTIYDGVEKEIEEFSQLIENDRIGSSICWEIYSSNILKLKNCKQFKTIELNSSISEKEIFKEIRNSDYYLAFYPYIFKDFITTKFYEIIALRCPIHWRQSTTPSPTSPWPHQPP